MEAEGKAKTDWRKALKVAVIGASIPTFLCCSCCILPSFPNQIKLQEYRSAFSRVKHPDDSIKLREASDYGLLLGNGNHCDYFVGEMRWSSLTPQELDKFYERQRVELRGLIRSWGTRQPELNFDQPKEEWRGFDNLLLQYWYVSDSDEDNAFDLDKVMKPYRERFGGKGTIYWVSINHSGDDPGWDWNCN